MIPCPGARQLPLRLNEYIGRKYWIYKNDKDKWSIIVAGSMPRPVKPLHKAIISFTRGSSKCPDYSGLVSSFKVIEDALIHCGVILDDNMDVIGKPDYIWVKTRPKEGFIKIEIQEL